MKRILYVFVLLVGLSVISLDTTQNTGEILLLRQHTEIDQHLRDILRFSNIDYLIIDFSGQGLNNKSYRIIVSEIWHGQVTNSTTIFNSADMPGSDLQQIRGNRFQIRVVSEATDENTLRVHFNLPGLTLEQEYDALQSDYYSLQHVYTKPETQITPGSKFFLLTYLLPYEMDGIKYYCSVETSGSDIFLWGEQYGIDHYLVFEMIFEE